MLKISDIICNGYEQFWRDCNKYRVMKGGKGSGKSSTTALNFITRLMKYKNSNLLVVRAVMNTHRDSTFAQLKWAQEKLGVAHLWQNNVSPMEMIYKPTGQKILFRGFDDVLKLASTTVSKGFLNFVWIEEAFEIESEADFDKLDWSVARSDVPEPLYNQFTITFNPWSETHWLKKRFFDTVQPNVSAYTTTYKQNPFLGKEFVQSMDALKETNPRKYDVAGLGNWGIAEGLVYENWHIENFDVEKLGADTEAEWQYRHFFGLDYGYTNDPTAFVAFAVNPITKELFIYDEHYETKMLNSDIAEMIKRKGFSKERIRADCAEPKSNDDLRRLGISRIAPSVKGKDSVINGITKLQEYRMFVLPSCKNMIAELSSYCWKKDRQTEKPLNEPEDTNNHLCDALRYAFYDVQFFRPVDPKLKKPYNPEVRYNITQNDFSGGWE